MGFEGILKIKIESQTLPHSADILVNQVEVTPYFHTQPFFYYFTFSGFLGTQWDPKFSLKGKTSIMHHKVRGK